MQCSWQRWADAASLHPKILTLSVWMCQMHPERCPKVDLELSCLISGPFAHVAIMHHGVLPWKAGECPYATQRTPRNQAFWAKNGIVSAVSAHILGLRATPHLIKGVPSPRFTWQTAAKIWTLFSLVPTLRVALVFGAHLCVHGALRFPVVGVVTQGYERHPRNLKPIMERFCTRWTTTCDRNLLLFLSAILPWFLDLLLHWMFPFSPACLRNLVKTSPKLWRKLWTFWAGKNP